MRRNGTVAFGAVSTAFIALFLFGLALLIRREIDLVIEGVTGNVEVAVYLDDAAKPDTVTHLQGVLQQLPAVASVDYENQQEACEHAKVLFANQPTIIENVQGSDLRRDLTLCGEMFGLGVIRHRYFEVTGFEVTQPQHRKHRGRVAGYRHGEWFDGPYFAVYGDGGGKGTVAQWQQAMGIDWTDVRKEIAEAIPPSYAEFVGRQLMAQLVGVAA